MLKLSKLVHQRLIVCPKLIELHSDLCLFLLKAIVFTLNLLDLSNLALKLQLHVLVLTDDQFKVTLSLGLLGPESTGTLFALLVLACLLLVERFQLAKLVCQLLVLLADGLSLDTLVVDVRFEEMLLLLERTLGVYLCLPDNLLPLQLKPSHCLWTPAQFNLYPLYLQLYLCINLSFLLLPLRIKDAKGLLRLVAHKTLRQHVSIWHLHLAFE